MKPHLPRWGFIVGVAFVVLLALTHLADAARPSPAPFAAPAQSGPNAVFRTIISFTSDLSSVTVDEVESGLLTTRLNWAVVNLGPFDYVKLDYYRRGNWAPVIPDAQPGLWPESLPVEVPVFSSGSFDPPAYRLQLIHYSTQPMGETIVLDEQLLVLPYRATDTTGAPLVPRIERFEATAQRIDVGLSGQQTPLVAVAWSVTGRLPTANLVFEQLLDDGAVVSAEALREQLWVPSQGESEVAPAPSESGSIIRLRLRLVDLVSGTVYDERILELPYTEALVVPTTTPLAPPASDTPVVLSVTTNEAVVPRGATVTVNWQTAKATSVVLEVLDTQDLLGQPVYLEANLPPNGSKTVTLPASVANMARFVVFALNTEGPIDPAAYPYYQARSKWTDVVIECPFTWAVPVSGGCPAGGTGTAHAAFQSFERGRLIWRSDTGEFYALYHDGTADYFTTDQIADLPDAPPETPPAGLLQPVSGFGRIWAHVPGVRDRLGWGLAPEFGYTMSVQDVAAPPTAPHGRAYRVFFTLPEGTWIGVAGTEFWYTIP